MNDLELLRLFDRRARLVSDYWKTYNSSPSNADRLLDELTIVHQAITTAINLDCPPINPTVENMDDHPFFQYWHLLRAKYTPTA